MWNPLPGIKSGMGAVATTYANEGARHESGDGKGNS